MRISIRLESLDGELTLPVHYNHLVQGMIYQSLDQALAQWLHERGFQYGKRRFKLFTFSRLLSRHRRLDSKGNHHLYRPPFSQGIEVDIRTARIVNAV